MFTIGLVLLFCGGGAFFRASPKIDTINKARNMVGLIAGGDQMQQLGVSTQGISPWDAALYHVAYGVGILFVVMGAALMILGVLKSRRRVPT